MDGRNDLGMENHQLKNPELTYQEVLRPKWIGPTIWVWEIILKSPSLCNRNILRPKWIAYNSAKLKAKPRLQLPRTSAHSDSIKPLYQTQFHFF